MRISYLPTSHQIEDDNSQYFSENELKIGGVSVLVNGDAVILDEFSLYKIRSFISHDPLIGGLSGQLNIGFLRAYDQELNKHGAFDISAGLGRSVEPHSSVLLYGIANLGTGYGERKGFGYVNPEIGAIFRTNDKQKLHISLEHNWNQFASSRSVNQVDLIYGKYFTNDWGMFFEYEYAFSDHEYSDSIGISIKRYF